MSGNDSNVLALPELYDFLLKFIIIGEVVLRMEAARKMSVEPERQNDHKQSYTFVRGLVLTRRYTLASFLCFGYLGDSGVGKSCLMHHFLNESVRDPSPHTIGVEFSSTLMRLPSSTPIAAGANGGRATNSKTLKVQLWDTAGQERFRSVTRNYYRGACGAIVVYDITSRESFESLGQWLADARALASPDLAVVLVGNKLDQEEWRQVPYLEASRWAQDHGIMFMETSSLSGENVEQPFILLARSILLAIESGQLDPEKTGSGVSYGERSLRRVSSWGSNLRPSRTGVLGGKCC